jgi:hypothetical protein
VPIIRCGIPLLDVVWRYVGVPDLGDRGFDDCFNGDFHGVTPFIFLWIGLQYIFPSVRSTRPTKTGKRVVYRADVIAYKKILKAINKKATHRLANVGGLFFSAP